ncbi:MAG: hypothetical protein WBB74_00530 [Gaiellaceae bacterium]
MAQRGQDLLSRLADAGEEAIQRLGEVPGTQRFLDAANGLRERVDELQRRVRGIDELERRIDSLERKVNELSKPSSGGTTRPTSASAKPRPRKSTGTRPKTN